MTENQGQGYFSKFQYTKHVQKLITIHSTLISGLKSKLLMFRES